MRKIVSRILYVMFFGFAVTLFTACIMLIINTAKGNGNSYYDLEAVVIDDDNQADNTGYERIETEVSANIPVSYKTIDLKYGYNALDSENKKYLYERLDSNIYSISDEKDQNGHYRIARLRVNGEKLSEFEIREIVNAYTYDNPQVFWLENLFGYAYAGEDTIVEFYSVLSAKECEECIVTFNSKVDEIISAVGENLSEYERERIIHDKLLSRCTYKSGVQASTDGWYYFSAYGAIVNGEAVCEGYAKSMQLLLSRVGIPCLTIRGEGEGVLHMWNVAELNNEWYHLDATWNDNDKDGSIIYEYFNINTETLNKNHIINDDLSTVLSVENSEDIDPTVRYNFFVPMCTSKEMNYYNVEGTLIENFDSVSDEQVIKALVKCVEGGNIYFPIRFGSSMTYNEYINKLFYQSPYSFYYYIDHANEQLDKEHQIKKDSVSVLKNESSMTLRVKLSVG